MNNNPVSDLPAFRQMLAMDFSEYLMREFGRFREEDCLRIDLHCHDHNSDQPDELWGRILRLPETWLKTRKLVKRLEKSGCTAITITNHNNARSCWDLQDQGVDVLSAAEFTCHFEEYNLFVHVLTFGFSREQERILNRKRQNIYEFLRYCASADIPVILPHPLYFYTPNEKIDLDLFEKLAVMFQRFEVLNGQRDLWQSLLTLTWTQSLTPEKIRAYASKHQLDPADFGVDPEKPKVLTGGSDDHMGIFAGDCGSRLFVADLRERLKTSKPSELALEAIRNGDIAPFGQVFENQKLNIALLDYFAQIATRIEDPGLLRILLHRGDTRDKVACLAIANVLLELQKHKNSRKFFDFIHDALQGKKPNKLLKWRVPKDYRICVDHLTSIADSAKLPHGQFVRVVNHSIHSLFNHLNVLLVKRLRKSVLMSGTSEPNKFSRELLASKFEIPSQITTLLYGGRHQHEGISEFNIRELLDQVSFPLLIGLVLTATTVASTRVLYQNRHFLNTFADYIGKYRHQKRALYLTDTLFDKNGVSNSLTGKLREIQRLDLPVDFLVCHEDVEAEAHLHVVSPLTSFAAPNYGEQEIRVPDLMEIARIFYEGGYDRIICSTEGPMALVSLLIKFKFNVPGYFFMHTDWLDFIRHTTRLNRHERDRVRRLLRALYRQYDGVFTLNSDHRAWLIGHEMELDENAVHLTAHHTEPRQPGIIPVKKQELFANATESTPVLFVASRLSREKGLFDLPDILHLARKKVPNLRLVIAGSGPAEVELRTALPDARFLGWVDRQTLASCYLGLDLFLFPSRFDTFGNVILEALTHGMPAIAYNCKGPKDIIEHGVSGYLADNKQQMATLIADYFSRGGIHAGMKRQAEARAACYRPEPIMRQFLKDMGLDYAEYAVSNRSAA